ncbi:hypothetical protein C8N32_10493 [Rhodovulum imhoffii]|uniref:Uncharacterized protein n=1 Tax=Rhodovulum imhoffii TaxID=365340 RepID=A0A2T5BU36_9RHOB|nr:DUF6478 family protein [Rhodovulum imhoffii]MBK5934601.1 hypothetical protein [Rhodovulum imhoffii]PTN02982.1 hypothetical protein C8N32_10493 [Rhodovulum imhoffii]
MVKSVLDSFLHKLQMRRWRKAGDSVTVLSLPVLHELRRLAATERQRIDRFTGLAAARLDAAQRPASVPQAPAGSDWVHRPDLWSGPVWPQGVVNPADRFHLGRDAKLFHDAKTFDLCLRQVPGLARAPYGLVLEVFGFDGSFLSLVVDCPPESVQGLKRRHIVQVDARVEAEAPQAGFMRLNILHGPNVEQITRDLPEGPDMTVEFDLAYHELNEKRIDSMWLDVILDRPRMNRVILADLVLSRRPRAEF